METLYLMKMEDGLQILDLHNSGLPNGSRKHIFLQKNIQFTPIARNSQKVDRVSRWLMKKVEVDYGEDPKELEPLNRPHNHRFRVLV